MINPQRGTPVFIEPARKTLSQKEYQRQLNKYILPVIGKKRIIDVKDTAVIRVVEELSDTAPIMSNRILATIKSMFSYATDTARVLKVNPVATIKKLAAEVVKERYLEQEEPRLRHHHHEHDSAWHRRAQHHPHQHPGRKLKRH